MRIATLALALLAAPLAAQELEAPPGSELLAPQSSGVIPNNASFGGWQVTCEAVGVGQTSCNLVQTLLRADDETLLLRLLVTRLGEDLVLLAQTPIGVYLPSGAVYQVEGDDTPQRDMVWQRCLGPLCEAALALDEEEIARIGEGTMLFGYRPGPGAEPVILQVTLDGLGEGIASVFPED
ncbi:invasion associated locus B family protein [Roseobacter sp. HKCCA0434]|uniref:invasion associated locus B family protein n=1 Tax=Roseobacter sp. HKCCA0434 TaxID=3079297 RepID=UPI002905DD16|nr:invasion associated locus B family protein [Roseobacter sp. HKCCA0434]